MILWGGGHSDYAGNEVYCLRSRHSPLTRLNDPSPIAECAEATPDGRANSRHTYGGLAYIAHADRMFVFGGGSFCTRGNSSSDTWTLNLETLEWKRMDPVHGGSPNGEFHGTVSRLRSRQRNWFTCGIALRASGLTITIAIPTSSQAAVAPLGLHTNAVVDLEVRAISRVWRWSNLGGADWPTKAVTVRRTNRTPRLRSTSRRKFAGSGLRSGAADESSDGRISGRRSTSMIPRRIPARRKLSHRRRPGDSAHSGSARSSNGTFGRFQYFPAARRICARKRLSNQRAHAPSGAVGILFRGALAGKSQ